MHRPLALLSIAVAFVAAACATPDPGLRVAAPPHATPAADVAWGELTFTGAGGVQLYGQHWRPVTGAPRGVLVIHHGLADHGARYAGLAEPLVRAGFAVWALDMRGHGRSAGARASSPSIDAFLDDLDAFLREVRAAEPGRPVFLMGHSLGGLITALYAIERQPDVAGVVLSAPGVAFDAPALQAGAIRLIAGLNPDAPLLATPHGDFSSDPAVIADMDRDPLIFAPKGPARTARAAIDGVARVWAHPEALRAPLLALHGTIDKLTAPSGSRDLVARAGATDKTLRLYPGLNHDLLHEPDGAGAQIAGEIEAWLLAHTGGPAVTFAASPTTGALKGDHGASVVAIEFDVRAEAPRDVDDVAVTGGLRLRAGVGRAGPGLGYLGGLDLRAGYLDGGHYELDGHLAGLALRSTGGALVAITGGVGVGGVRGAGALDAPVELAVELPAGPTRLMARAGLAWRLTGDAYADDALGVADEASALVGLRLGRDRRYWSTVAAGAGPFLALTYRNLGGGELYGVAVGGQLWGGR